MIRDVCIHLILILIFVSIILNYYISGEMFQWNGLVNITNTMNALHWFPRDGLDFFIKVDILVFLLSKIWNLQHWFFYYIANSYLDDDLRFITT